MQYAAGYWASKSAGRIAVSAFAKRAAAFPGMRRGGRLLEIGCGYGADAVFFARRGYRVTALDFSQKSVEETAEGAAAAGCALRVLRHDIARLLPLRSSGFDAVYAHLSLHYFDAETTARIFAEACRVLRPGGLFFVKCKSTDDPLYGCGEKMEEDMYRLDHARHFFSRGFMAEMLRGFQIARLRRCAASYDGKRACFLEAVARKPRRPTRSRSASGRA